MRFPRSVSKWGTQGIPYFIIISLWIKPGVYHHATERITGMFEIHLDNSSICVKNTIFLVWISRALKLTPADHSALANTLPLVRMIVQGGLHWVYVSEKNSLGISHTGKPVEEAILQVRVLSLIEVQLRVEKCFSQNLEGLFWQVVEFCTFCPYILRFDGIWYSIYRHCFNSVTAGCYEV